MYVTHDQVEAMTMADRIFVLNAGQIEQIGTPSEIYRTPASTFVASFMGAPPMNLVSAKALGGQVVIGDSAFTLACADGDVTLGIRPEQVTLSDTGTIPFKLTLVEELGASRLLHGKLAGQDFVVNAPNDDAALADDLLLDFPQDALHLFDAITGTRL
jgi:sn-glycerol 3-phosphate transport system ATP-binding protein